MEMVGFLNKILQFNNHLEVRIDEEACTGCGKCVKICPQIFCMEDDLAVIINYADLPQFKKACKKAADACSLGAIIIE
jgi:ferredoxin